MLLRTKVSPRHVGGAQETPFTDYVRALSEGKEPDQESYEVIRHELRSLVGLELRRRGLHHAPPHFLGSCGSEWGEEQMEDLVTETYTFSFLERLRGLMNLMRIGENIDPIIRLNVRNCITDLHRKADPLGYRTFGRLEEALRLAVDRQLLFLIDKSGLGCRLRNDTILGFRVGSVDPLAERGQVASAVQSWNDDLLPDLLTAESRAVPRVIEQLVEKIVRLPESDILIFRFGDLVNELKEDSRKRWASAWEKDLGPLGFADTKEGEARTVPIQTPGEPDFERLIAGVLRCVEASIEHERLPKRRRQLSRLWVWIRATRILPMDDGPLPSFEKLGRELKMSRDRVRHLFGFLRRSVENCLKPTVGASGQISRPIQQARSCVGGSRRK